MLYFTSRNPEVATVSDSGVVTGVGVGDTVIDVNNGDLSYRGTIPVHVDPAVQPSDRVPVTSIKVEPYRVKLFYINPTAKQLKATVLPDNATDKSIVWEVSDPEAISCVNGYVKCLKTKEGTFGVTARSKSDPSVLFNCVVEVTKEGTYVKSISAVYIDKNGKEHDLRNYTIPEEGGEIRMVATLENFNKYYSGVYSGFKGIEGMGYWPSSGTDGPLSADKKTYTMVYTLNRNTGVGRNLTLWAKGALTDDTEHSIPFNIAECTIATKFLYDSATSLATTWFSWNRNIIYEVVREYEVGSQTIKDYSGGQIIYFDCIEKQYRNICDHVISSAPEWLAASNSENLTSSEKSRMTINGWRKDIGGMFNIVVRNDNESSATRTATLTFPGGLVYTVHQKGKPATTNE